MVLSDLEEMKNDEIKILTSDHEILYRWLKIGLLDNINVDQRLTLALYFESSLKFMKGYYLDIELPNKITIELVSVLFPLINRLYFNNKLPYTFFQHTNEDHRYLSSVQEFTNAKCFESTTEVQNIMYDFHQFLPDLVLDFNLFCVKNYQFIDENLDIEAELLCRYCDQFNIENLNYEK